MITMEVKKDEKIEKVINEITSVYGSNDNKIYKSHLYWSQKPYNICDILIENLSQNGDIVCDPFMGSGVTIIESLKNIFNRKAVGIEINDFPMYIVKTILEHNNNYLKFSCEIANIKNKLKEYEDIYLTTCPNCGKPQVIEKTLFNYDKNSNKIVEKIFYRCGCSNNKLLDKIPDENDFEKFSCYENKKLSYFKNINLIPNSRIAVKENQTLYDIFTSRNRKALDCILKLVKKSQMKDLLIYAILGMLHLCKIVDVKSSSQWPLWTPNHDCIEKNVFNLFYKSLDKTLEAILAIETDLSAKRREVSNFTDLNDYSYMLLKKGTQQITENDIPDDCIDLIITDPPYLGQVIYSEYTQLYKSILNNEIDYENEIVISNAKGRFKTEELYYQELNTAFQQISRILKPDKYLCVYFHDSNLKFWDQYITIMKNNHLGFLGLTHINKKKNTLKNIVSPQKSLNGDALLFFKKTNIIYSNVSSENYIEDIKQISKNIVVRNNGKATTAQLYDNGVLEYIINNNLLSKLSKQYKDLTFIFSQYLIWNEAEGYWTL